MKPPRTRDTSTLVDMGAALANEETEGGASGPPAPDVAVARIASRHPSLGDDEVYDFMRGYLSAWNNKKGVRDGI